MRRLLRHVTTSPCRSFIIRQQQQQQQRQHGQHGQRLLTTIPGTTLPPPPPPPSTTTATISTIEQPQQPDGRSMTTTSGLLSQFYRALATQNMDQLWPLYSTMYQTHLHTRLTRNNYRQLVQVAARSAKTQRNLHRLLAIMEDMQQLAFPLRLSDYNIVMRWVGGATVPERRPRHVNDALSWLATLENQQQHPHQIEPNVVTYNTLIHVAAQANDILTAQRLYHAMLAKGIEADAYTYTTLLHSMATMGDVQGVQDMVTRLERKGLQALLHSTVTWNILLDCYYSSSSLMVSTATATATATEQHNGEKEDDHDDDDDDGRRMTTTTATTTTTEMKTKDDLQQQQEQYHNKANDMFQAMIHALDNKGTAPKADAITVQIHMNHLLRHHRRDDAIKLLQQLNATYPIQPTITMYNKLFASFMNNKNNNTTATTIINTNNTSSSSSLEQLRQLYASLLQQQQPTSETLYTLINALLDHHDTTFALEAFVHLCQENQLTPCQELLDRLSGVVQDQDTTYAPPPPLV